MPPCPARDSNQLKGRRAAPGSLGIGGGLGRHSASLAPLLWSASRLCPDGALSPASHASCRRIIFASRSQCRHPIEQIAEPVGFCALYASQLSSGGSRNDCSCMTPRPLRRAHMPGFRISTCGGEPGVARQRGASCSCSQCALMAPLAGGGMQKLPSLLPPGTGDPPERTGWQLLTADRCTIEPPTEHCMC